MESGAEIFLEEAHELLEEIEDTLLELKDNPADIDLVNKLFRAVHTIKGSGAMFGFDRVADFSHKFETAIDAVRQGEAVLTGDLIDNLLAARDHILKMIDATDDDLKKIASDSDIIIAGLSEAGSKAGGQVEAEDHEAGEEGGKEQVSPQKEVSGLKILIVEDEFVSRYLLQEFLMNYGISHVAVNGFEAIIAFKRALSENKPYDMICLDIMMPGMDGRAVAKEVRRLEAELGPVESCRIVMTTAVHDQGVIAEFLEEKLCDAFLNKPLDMETLRGKIAEFFGGQ